MVGGTELKCVCNVSRILNTLLPMITILYYYALIQEVNYLMVSGENYWFGWAGTQALMFVVYIVDNTTRVLLLLSRGETYVQNMQRTAKGWHLYWA